MTSIFTPKITYASGEFNITQNFTYTVNSLGVASVHQEVNLTNNFSQIYAKEYTITLTGTNIKNITGNDSSGNIIKNIVTQNDQTLINLQFSVPAIGKDQIKNFSLDYSLADFAKKKGNTWEIQFPVFSPSAENQQTTLSLNIPATFGDLSFSSIPVNDIHNLSSSTQINFSPNQVTSNKILLVFGNHQLFDFSLNYFLQNTDSQTINTEIPIPPDTDSQTITLKSLEPPPTSIKSDADGNWLAQYTIPKQQSLNITVVGQARIHPVISIESKPLANEYLTSQTYWPTTDPRIMALSSSLNSPKQIYQYVVSTLNYDYNHIDTAIRKGALIALDSPNSSLCTEFTDLFVTLARAKGISAREIEGFAYSNDSKIKPINTNSDVLHAWPEYYDSNTQSWHQVDPTWEKTTNGIDYFNDLDLNHLTFVIHGLQSNSPSPPGSYKKDTGTKSVFVNFATEELKPKFISPQISLSGTTLTIKNPNLFSLHSLDLNITDSSFHTNISSMPPLGTVNITISTVSFFRSILPQSKNYHLSLTLNEASNPISYPLANPLHYLNLCICIGIVIFLLCLGGIILTASHKPYEKTS